MWFIMHEEVLHYRGNGSKTVDWAIVLDCSFIEDEMISAYHKTSFSI